MMRRKSCWFGGPGLAAVLAGLVMASTAEASVGLGPKGKGQKAEATATASELRFRPPARVVVVGSHIPRSETVATTGAGSSPVQVITQERMRRMGVTSVSAALRRTGFGR